MSELQARYIRPYDPATGEKVYEIPPNLPPGTQAVVRMEGGCFRLYFVTPDPKPPKTN